MQTERAKEEEKRKGKEAEEEKKEERGRREKKRCGGSASAVMHVVSSLKVTLQLNVKRSRVSWRLKFYWFCWYELVFGMGGLGFCWVRGI